MSATRAAMVVLLLGALAPLDSLAFMEYEKGTCASFVSRGVIKTFCSQLPLDPLEEEVLGKTLRNMARREETPDKSHIEISRPPEAQEVQIRFFSGTDGNVFYASGTGKDFFSALQNIRIVPSHMQ
jgi:hypothetical protein